MKKILALSALSLLLGGLVVLAPAAKACDDNCGCHRNCNNWERFYNFRAKYCFNGNCWNWGNNCGNNCGNWNNWGNNCGCNSWNW